MDTGWLTAGLATEVAYNNGSIWSDMNNAKISDNVYALSYIDSNSPYCTKYLKLYNFNANIPIGSIINGIMVQVERKESGVVTDHIKDKSIKLVRDGTIEGEDKPSATNWTSSDVIIEYGSSVSLWGLSWIADQVNSVNTGVVFSAKKVFPEIPTAYVDMIKMKIYYVLPSPKINNVSKMSISKMNGVSVGNINKIKGINYA